MKKIILLMFFVLLTFFGCEQLENEIEEIIPEKISEENQIEKQIVKINRVIDGDTVEVELSNGDIEPIRLLLIDTPESVHPEKPEQPYGKEASKFAKEILTRGKKVQLEKGSPERDKYDRLLGYIFIEDKNFNKMMIEEGYARIAYVYEPNTKYLKDFEKAQRKARENKINIWSINGYVESEFEDY